MTVSKAIIGGIAALAMGYVVWNHGKQIGCVIKEIPKITSLDKLKEEIWFCEPYGKINSKIANRPQEVIPRHIANSFAINQFMR